MNAGKFLAGYILGLPVLICMCCMVYIQLQI